MPLQDLLVLHHFKTVRPVGQGGTVEPVSRMGNDLAGLPILSYLAEENKLR